MTVAGEGPSAPRVGSENVRVGLFKGDPSEWDALVARAAGGTHFHRHGWKRVMERALGHSCSFLEARDRTGVLVGLLPLVYVGSPIFGRFVVSMPFLNYGGPLGSEEAVSELGRAALEEKERRNAGLVELRSPEPLGLPWAVSHRKVTVVLDLPDDPDALMDSFKAKLRSQIRRPLKEGIKLRRGPDQLPAFYSVFSRHMRDLGTPVLPLKFFREVVDTFPDSVRMTVAYLGDAPIAGGLGFVWGAETEVTWASSLMAHKRIAANMAVYWDLMEHSIQEGLDRFNFGRCSPGAGTHRFKLQWGGREEPLYWYQASDSGEGRTPSPDDPSFAWGPRIWRRLPLRLANRLGPWIVRLIP